MEKYDFETLKAHFKKNWCVLPKMRTRLVEILGKNYWMELSNKEFDKLFDESAFLDMSHLQINTKEKLEDFMVKCMGQDLDLKKNLPWRFCCVPDFDGTSGYVTIIIHHSFMDGISTFSCLEATSETKDMKNLT